MALFVKRISPLNGFCNFCSGTRPTLRASVGACRIVCKDNGQVIAADMTVLMRPVFPSGRTSRIIEELELDT